MKPSQYSDYKAFVTEHIYLLPGKGRGAYRRMAEHLGVHASLMTQVFQGDKDLTLEQGYLLTEFLGLNDNDADHFLLLLQISRASGARYRDYLSRKIQKTSGATEEGQKPDFDRASQTLFYSAWYYTAVHLMATFTGGCRVATVSERLRLDPALVKGVLGFLVSAGLCSVKNGLYRAKIFSTRIQNDRPLSIAHNTNWRYKAVERVSAQKEEDLFFTNVVSISAADASRIQKLLRGAISQCSPIIEVSPAEELYCLNIDWFGLPGKAQ